MALGAENVQPARLAHTGAEHDVGTTPRHVGGNGDSLRLTRLGDDRRLPLVLLGVQHLVRYALAHELLGKSLRSLDGRGTDKHWASSLALLLDVADHGAELAALVLEYQVAVILANHRLVRRDDEIGRAHV